MGLDEFSLWYNEVAGCNPDKVLASIVKAGVKIVRNFGADSVKFYGGGHSARKIAAILGGTV